MVHAEDCYVIFQKSIDDYHLKDNVDTPIKNPFPDGSFESLLYVKNWIDTVQWHLEDIIRNPEIDPAVGLQIKRRIDRSNQERTDTVEKIDDHFLETFRQMTEQVDRKDVSIQHVAKCREKLSILEEQKEDMRQAFDQLIEDISAGARRFKVYRQMKMYNDETLNPVLYKNSTGNQTSSR
jgi:hypothetical protein